MTEEDVDTSLLPDFIYNLDKVWMNSTLVIINRLKRKMCACLAHTEKVNLETECFCNETDVKLC